MTEPKTALFRPQALAFHRRGGLRGDVLHITPDMLRAVFWLVLALALCAVGFVVTAQVTDYASGPAVVMLDNRREVTAHRAGVVTEVVAQIGEHVHAGDVLVRLYAATEAAELASVERELSDQLIVLMRNPGDRGAREAVLSLRTRKAVAQTAIERGVVRAPVSGVVADLRARPGQAIEAGSPIAAVQSEPRGASVTALLPGPERPRMHPGMPLRLQISGFERSALQLTVDRVDEQVLGPAEAVRAIGSDLAGAFEVHGPIVLVHAQLAADSFDSSGVRYALHHGMPARAELPVRREPLLYAFFPGLQEALSDVF